MTETHVIDGVAMGIGEALDAMRAGRKVTRVGWNGPRQYVQLQNPDANSKMTLPYLYITTVLGNLVPWVASQTDLLAYDWKIVND